MVCWTRVHAATIQTGHDMPAGLAVQTGHDMLERDFKAMKDNYDKILFRKPTTKCIVY